MPAKSSERKVIYLQRKEKGYCPRCGSKVRKSSKFTYCEDCRTFFRNYSQKNSKSLNKIRKAQYDERKETKRCPRCGKHLGKKYERILCSTCLDKQYKYNYGRNRPKIKK